MKYRKTRKNSNRKYGGYPGQGYNENYSAQLFDWQSAPAPAPAPTATRRYPGQAYNENYSAQQFNWQTAPPVPAVTKSSIWSGVSGVIASLHPKATTCRSSVVNTLAATEGIAGSATSSPVRPAITSAQKKRSPTA